jgi:ATP-dependent DNA helicase RecQ
MRAAVSRAPEGGVEWADVIREARRFGVRAFRPGQRALIEAVLGGRDAIGVWPTRTGRALCYQLPALCAPEPTVVVSSHGVPARERIARCAPLLYVTPERLQTEDGLALLRRRGVSRLVVDDPHGASASGHELRRAYLGLAQAARRLGRPPILVLLAAATAETTRALCALLRLRDPIVVRPGGARGGGAS